MGKRSLKDFIPKSDIKVKATRTGIGNLYGNKGAVGVSFRINRTSFCFINAHLAAHRANRYLQDRIEDLVLIVQGLELGDKQIDFTHQFHVMYLLGDLNFRMRGDYTSETVINMIEKGKHLQLLAKDELTTLRAPYSYRNTGYSFAELTNNPLYDAYAQQNNQLHKANTDPLLGRKLVHENEYHKNAKRCHTGPIIKHSRFPSDDSIEIGVSYDETIALFKHTKEIDAFSALKNTIKLNNIHETMQSEENIPTHKRYSTTLIHEIGSNEDLNHPKISSASSESFDDECMHDADGDTLQSV